MSTKEDCAKNFPHDVSLYPDAQLLRRIPRYHFHFDAKLNRMRPSSAAFEDDDDGDPMSVYRRDIIESEGDEVGRVMARHEGFALASLTVEQTVAKEQTVSPDPLPEESSHTRVCGPKSASVRKSFAKQAEWVISPAD